MTTEAKTIFSPELAARFDKLVTLYPVRRSALIPMLLYAQDEQGYVTEAAMEEIAERIGITVLDVRNVLSYYSLLRTKPVGKYHVQVCTNISCMLRGANELFAHCQQRLGIGNKQTTPDGLFSLEEVECIGACSWGPAVQVNYDFHDNLTNASMDTVLDQYRKQAGK
ncbi:MAG TPA: NAD(P)H-dependent oxidoreductase subunit E [Acidobacteriaceae bacterium]|jgi:NADH-quinone oxidoreductase subunit E|nr:NAD(P)H-dependent oxidoreductase subunit E [Acidobacteriaceae bacterium]